MVRLPRAGANTDLVWRAQRARSSAPSRPPLRPSLGRAGGEGFHPPNAADQRRTRQWPDHGTVVLPVHAAVCGRQFDSHAYVSV